MSEDGWLDGAGHRFGAAGERLAQVCRSCLEGAHVDGVGLSVIAGDASPETVYATSDLGAELEDLQFTLGEGPCVDSARWAVPVMVPHLDGATRSRWPAFVDHISSHGVAAMFAFPVRVGAVSLGTLDLHRLAPGPLGSEELAFALTTVDRVAVLLIAVTAGGLEGDLPDTSHRMLVHQAAGMAMMQLDSSIEEAMLRLRATAFVEDIPLHHLAADLVSRRRRLTRETPRASATPSPAAPHQTPADTSCWRSGS